MEINKNSTLVRKLDFYEQKYLKHISDTKIKKKQAR